MSGNKKRQQKGMRMRTAVLNGWHSKGRKRAQLWDKASCQIRCHCCHKAKRGQRPQESPPGM